MKRIYRVKITQCSLNFMWYKNRIGEEFECEVVKNSDTLFASYADSSCSYRSTKDIIILRQVFYELIVLPNGFEKLIRLNEPKLESISVKGWILEQDADIMYIKEGIVST